MRIRGALLGCVAIAAVCAGAVHADEAKEKGKGGNRAARLFSSLDANGDGQVAGDEVSEDRRRLFERLVKKSDDNDDGQLSQDELAAGLGEGSGRRDDDDRGDDDRRRRRRGDRDRGQDGPPRGPEGRPGGPDGPPRRPGRPDGPPPMPGPGPLMRVLDSDHDGRLSSGEIAAASEALRELDRDEDGEITIRELFAAGGDRRFGEGGPPRGRRPEGGPDGPQRRGRRPEGDDGPPRARRPEGAPDGPPRRGPRPDGDDGPRGRRPERGDGPPPLDRILDRILESDTDGDDRLSKDEAPERLKRAFGQFDGNDDGFIDRAELEQRLSRAMRERRGPRPEGGRRRRPERRERPDDASTNEASTLEATTTS